MALPENQPYPRLRWSRGERMAKARESVGLTQIQMAADLTTRGRPCSDSTVAAWEGERNQPKKMMDLLKLWSEITDVPVAELLGDEISSVLNPVLTVIHGTLEDRRGIQPQLPLDVPLGIPDRRRPDPEPLSLVSTGA